MGLIFAELIKRVPFLAGESDIAQLHLIARALGTPTEQNWPGVTRLPAYVIGNPENPQPEADKAFYRGQFYSVSAKGQELMRDMLRLDPRNRVTARQALWSEWFTEDPMPKLPQELPIKKDKAALEKVGMDLKRRAGQDETLDGAEMEKTKDRGNKVARKLNFGN